MDKNKVKGNIINNVLFSVSNVEGSIIRGDNYVGKVIRDDSNNYRVKIDLELAKRIKKNKFKSISRSNGTSICIIFMNI